MASSPETRILMAFPPPSVHPLPAGFPQAPSSILPAIPSIPFAGPLEKTLQGRPPFPPPRPWRDFSTSPSSYAPCAKVLRNHRHQLLSTNFSPVCSVMKNEL